MMRANLRLLRAASVPASGVTSHRLLHASRSTSLLFRTPADVQQDASRVVTSENGALESRLVERERDPLGARIAWRQITHHGSYMYVCAL